MTYTVGPCAAADRCRTYDRITQQPGDATRHALCDPCLTAGEFAARALPRDWLDLEQLLPPGASTREIRTHDGDPVPLNLAAEALQRAIWWVCTTWEDVCRDLDRLADVPGRGVRDGVAVVRACRILAPRIGALADTPQVLLGHYPLADDDELHVFDDLRYTWRTGAQAVLDLARLHRRAAAMLGLTSPVRHLPGVCPGCGAEDLRQNQPRYRGDDPFVYCGACDCVRPYDEYARNTGLMGVGT